MGRLAFHRDRRRNIAFIPSPLFDPTTNGLITVGLKVLVWPVDDRQRGLPNNLHMMAFAETRRKEPYSHKAVHIPVVRLNNNCGKECPAAVVPLVALRPLYNYHLNICTHGPVTIPNGLYIPVSSLQPHCDEQCIILSDDSDLSFSIAFPPVSPASCCVYGFGSDELPTLVYEPLTIKTFEKPCSP